MNLFISLKPKVSNIQVIREVHFYESLIDLVQSFCSEIIMFRFYVQHGNSNFFSLVRKRYLTSQTDGQMHISLKQFVITFHIYVMFTFTQKGYESVCFLLAKSH